MQPEKAMFRDTAGEVVPEFALDESRDGTLAVLLPGKERLQWFGNHAVQNGLFRLAWNVRERSVDHVEP